MAPVETRTHALLVALAQEFAAVGISVLRCDLPYRQRRPHGPPSPATAKEDQEGLRRAVTLMREQFAGRAFLGGSSYGGRQASLSGRFTPGLGRRVCCCSPTRFILRESRLNCGPLTSRSCQTPSLFVSGTKDAFGTIEELEAAIKLIPARTELVKIDGASHGLSKPASVAVTEIIRQSFLDFFVRNALHSDLRAQALADLQEELDRDDDT